MGHEFLPVVSFFCLIVESLQSFLIHCLLNVLEHDWELMRKSLPFDLRFFTTESDNCFNFLILDVFGTNLKSNWHTFELPMIEFPSWIIVISQIDVDSYVSLFQSFVKSIGSSINLLFFSFEWDRHNNYLHICNSRRKH